MSYPSKIQDNTFAQACYDQNNIEQLLGHYTDADADYDAEKWHITRDEARAQVRLALAAKLETAFYAVLELYKELQDDELFIESLVKLATNIK